MLITNITISISDGISNNSSEINAIKDDNYTFTLQLKVSENATGLYVLISSKSPSAVISISKIYANIGCVAIETLPPMVNGVIGERKQYIATQNPPAE